MENEVQSPFVEGAPRDCAACGAPLCLRKQVINLAMGNTETMHCLGCLAKESDETPAGVLANLMSYVQMRDCFAKEWKRYSDVSFCPDRQGCHPDLCFEVTKHDD